MNPDENDLNIDLERMERRLATLAEFTDPQRPYTRRGLSPLYSQARDYLKEEFESAGLEVSFDSAANMTGRLEGSDRNLPAIGIGSHIDTVEAGGRYDGTLGVVSALEAAQCIVESGNPPLHSIEVIDFLTEEPSNYGASCIGSRAIAGTLNADMLSGTNEHGESLGQAMERMGARPAELSGPLRESHELAAFVELHIEQGRILEQRDVPIGIVTGIVAVSRYSVVFTGRADHAGTTPMDMRRDAFVAASRFVDATYRRAKRIAETTMFVATVGRATVYPNAANVVPSSVELVLEVRSLDESAIAEFCDTLSLETAGEAGTLGVSATFRQISSAPAAPADETVQAAIESACETRGVAQLKLPSGAGHDAMQMAALYPMGMIFVPCRNGVSHHPDEFVERRHVGLGADILLETVRTLDYQHREDRRQPYSSVPESHTK